MLTLFWYVLTLVWIHFILSSDRPYVNILDLKVTTKRKW
jgi:hypothetical protein